ncbi:TPA: hypothetical protein ACUNCG_000436 [Aeromonas hydrophila]
MKKYNFYDSNLPLLMLYSTNYGIRMPFIQRFGNTDTVNMNEFSEWIEEWVNTPSEKESIAKFKQDIKDVAQVSALTQRTEQYKLYLQGRDTNPYS